MKNSIIYLGIALVGFASVSNAIFDTKNEVKASKVKTLENTTNVQWTSLLLVDMHYEKTNATKPVFIMDTVITGDFKIAAANEANEKTADQLIAEDNAITENTISNETQALDFNVIYTNSIVDETIESVTANKIDKTADQLIAEDNAITENTISNETQALDFNVINANSIVYETIESVTANKIEETADQLIAEDNAITENTISNETQVLDFNVINANSIVYETIESVTANKIEKTADQLIAEDNAITENTISNETFELDFNIINKNQILIFDNNNSLLVVE